MSLLSGLLLLTDAAQSTAEAAGQKFTDCFKAEIDARVAGDWPPLTTVQPATNACERELEAAKSEVIDTIRDGDKSVAITAADISAFVAISYAQKLNKDRWVRSRAKNSWVRYTDEMDDDERRMKRPSQITWSEYHNRIRWHAESLYYPKGQSWIPVGFLSSEYTDPDRINFDYALGGFTLGTDGLGLDMYSDGERVFFFFRPADQETGRVSWTRIVVTRIFDDGRWHVVSAREHWRCGALQTWTAKPCKSKS